MIKLKDLIKAKINDSNDEKQKTSLLNVNDELIVWYELINKFNKYSHRLPEKVSTEFKDFQLLKIWNRILKTHARLLENFIESIKNDIDNEMYNNFKTLTRIVNEFILNNFSFNLDEKLDIITQDNNKDDNEIDKTQLIKKTQSTDKKTIFVIGLHPSLQKHVNELLFELLELTRAKQIDKTQIIHKFMKLLQLTLISYTRIHCKQQDVLWDEHLIPDFINEVNIILRFTELKKKIRIGTNVLKQVYLSKKYNNEDIQKLPFYILAQTSMYPGSKIKNYQDILCKITLDYIEKIRYRNLTEFFRSETQTYTYSIILTNVFSDKNKLTKDDKKQLRKYIRQLIDIIHKYRFSSYKYTKEHKIIDKEFYLDLYDLYIKTLNKQPVTDIQKQKKTKMKISRKLFKRARKKH